MKNDILERVINRHLASIKITTPGEKSKTPDQIRNENENKTKSENELDKRNRDKLEKEVKKEVGNKIKVDKKKVDLKEATDKDLARELPNGSKSREKVIKNLPYKERKELEKSEKKK